MPISYKVDEPRRRILTVASGTVTVLEVIGHFEMIRRAGLLTYAELIDASGIARPTMSVSEIWKAAMAVRDIQPPKDYGARAVLVANDTMFGMARIFATLMSGYFPFQVFRDLSAAEDWLGLNPQIAAG